MERIVETDRSKKKDAEMLGMHLQIEPSQVMTMTIKNNGLVCAIVLLSIEDSQPPDGDRLQP